MTGTYQQASGEPKTLQMFGKVRSRVFFFMANLILAEEEGPLPWQRENLYPQHGQVPAVSAQSGAY